MHTPPALEMSPPNGPHLILHFSREMHKTFDSEIRSPPPNILIFVGAALRTRAAETCSGVFWGKSGNKREITQK